MTKEISKHMFNAENLTLWLTSIVNEQIKKNQILYSNTDNNPNRFHSRWTNFEDEKLKELVNKFGTKKWRKVSSLLEGRTPLQCFYRWNKVLKCSNNLWTETEDLIIKQFVSQNGYSKWTQCAKLLRLRTSNQIKQHWFNDLANKEILTNHWTEEEELKLLVNTSSYGTCWSKMRHFFPGRDENNIKNKFYSILRRTASKILGHENPLASNILALKQNQLIRFIPNALTDISQKIQNKNLNIHSEVTIQQISNEISLNPDSIKNMYFCSHCKEYFKTKMKEKLLMIYKHNELLNNFTEKLEYLKEKQISFDKNSKINTIVEKIRDEFSSIQKQL